MTSVMPARGRTRPDTTTASTSPPPAPGFALAALILAWPGWALAEPEATGEPPRSVASAEYDDSRRVGPGPSHPGNGDSGLEDIDLLEMEMAVVVTATRREQPLTSVPYAVSVVTADDIRRSGARSIADALRLVPGVDVADLTFNNAAISPRGSHGLISNQALVLVDGRQIFDSVFGGTLWGNWPFQLEDIERIEVIRGPGGVTWGANALNGVINVITKDPADQLGLSITSGGGSRGTWRQRASYGHAEEKLRLRLSGQYEASDGFKRGGSPLRQLDDYSRAGQMSLHGVYEPTDRDSLTFSGGSAVVDGGFPPTPLAILDGRTTPGSQASFLMTRWRRQVNPANEIETTFYVNDFALTPGVASIDYRYQNFALQLQHVWHPDEDQTLTWGVDTRADLFDGTNAEPHMLSKDDVSTGLLGVYAQYDWVFAPRWTAHWGGRIDYEFYGGFQPSARAAISHQLSENHALHGAVSRSFQMLPAAATHLDLPLVGGLAHITADRDVKAQTVLAYELGYRGRFFNRIDTSANLFWHEADDVESFAFELGPPGLLRRHLTNRGAASTYGVELEARYQVNPQLTLLGNYTFQHLDWRVSQPFTYQDFITPPEHKFMVGARYSPTDDLHLSSHLYFVDDVEAPNPSWPFVARQVDSYFRLDLLAEHEFWDDRASVSVGVKNLIDDHHHEGGTIFINDAEVPRMIFAEFRISLK